MQVVVYSTIFKDKDKSYVQELFDVLHEENINAYVYEPYLEQLQGKIKFKRDVDGFAGYVDFTMDKRFDCVIALGGDGTMLAATSEVRDSNIPIMGINLGRLGFLASIEKKRIREAIGLLKRGRWTIDERYLLHLDSNLPLFGEMPFALNDCTLLKRDTSSMISIHTFINGAYLNTYWADGVIIATFYWFNGLFFKLWWPYHFPSVR